MLSLTALLDAACLLRRAMKAHDKTLSTCRRAKKRAPSTERAKTCKDHALFACEAMMSNGA